MSDACEQFKKKIPAEELFPFIGILKENILRKYKHSSMFLLICKPLRISGLKI